MAREPSAIDRRFDVLEKRAEQQARQQTQEQERALKRRFASIGGLGSGASIKAGQLARQEGGKAIARAREGIEAQRLGEMQRRQETQEAREFARGEREAQQQFAGEQAKLGREFARGERVFGQEFARGERLGQQQFSGQQAQLQRDLAESQFGREFDLKEREFGLNTQVTKANLATSFIELQALIKEEGLQSAASMIFSPEVFKVFGIDRSQEQIAGEQAKQVDQDKMRAVQEFLSSFGRLTGGRGQN